MKGIPQSGQQITVDILNTPKYNDTEIKAVHHGEHNARCKGLADAHEFVENTLLVLLVLKTKCRTPHMHWH